MKKTRQYLTYLNKAILAIEAAIDNFNRVNNPYRNEATLLLISNAWELLAKAVLVKKHISIKKDVQNTISAEYAISRITQRKILESNQNDLIQQIISLRNHAAHNVLPAIPDEIMQHLLFFGCKFFRETVGKVFPTKVKDLKENYLSLSFSNLTTYADKVQKLVSKIKKSSEGKELIWLLERAIRYDGGTYISQGEFEKLYKRKNKIMPHLEIGDFIKNSVMIRIVPVQAPKNYTADISLRKGSPHDATLPVHVKKTDIEEDYPYLTHEVAEKLKKNPHFTAKIIAYLKLKGNSKYHLSIRTSKKGEIQRYSQASLEEIGKFLKNNPDFSPYKGSKVAAL